MIFAALDRRLIQL